MLPASKGFFILQGNPLSRLTGVWRRLGMLTEGRRWLILDLKLICLPFQQQSQVQISLGGGCERSGIKLAELLPLFLLARAISLCGLIANVRQK